MTHCFHCGLPSDEKFSIEIAGRIHFFCCPGCQAVSRLIHQSGFEDFYLHRDQPALKPPPLEHLSDFSIYDDADYQREFVTNLNTESIDVAGAGDQRLARIQIHGMNCSACAWLVEKQLANIDGVTEARVNYSQRTLFLQWNDSSASLSELLTHVSALGFEVSPSRYDKKATQMRGEEKLFLRRIGVAGIGMMQVGMYAMAGYFGASEATLGILRFASLLITTLVVFYAAQPFFAGAARALTHRNLSMDVPVATALGLAYSASLVATWLGLGGTNSAGGQHTEVYFDAVCMFTFFLLLSRYLEFTARSHWQKQRVMANLDDLANLVDKHGNQTAVAIRSLREAQFILVKTGEQFPVDVQIQSVQGGDSDNSIVEINQAQLTGEFAPLTKTIGDEISSGSINVGAPVIAKVLRPFEQSTVAQIQVMVDQAQLHKPHISGLADQISGYFVFTVLLVAAASYFAWLQIAPERAFWIALSVLVVSCPCALSLATPTALTVLMHHLQKRGVLVQNSLALETLEKVDHIVFDKTGTLTRGEFRINSVEDLTGEGRQLQIARAQVLETNSNHPIAKAFYPDSESSKKKPNCTDWRFVDSLGVEALVDGEKMRIGEKTFVGQLVGRQQRNLSDKDTEDSGKLIYLGQEGRWLATFSISDELRPEAKQLVNMLRNSNADNNAFEKTLSIFSGDSSEQVDMVAKALRIQNVEKGINAAEKRAEMASLQQQGHCVLAVGDGINDGPLLAASDVSIAVASAADISKQKADFILLSNDLTAIQELFENAIKGKTVIAQNLAWALTYNLCAIPLAVAGLIPPWLAALGMSASSALVVINAFRARTSHSYSRRADVPDIHTENYRAKTVVS